MTVENIKGTGQEPMAGYKALQNLSQAIWPICYKDPGHRKYTVYFQQYCIYIQKEMETKTLKEQDRVVFRFVLSKQVRVQKAHFEF